MTHLKPHIFVVRWPSVSDNVADIISGLQGLPGRKTVLDKTDLPTSSSAGWEHMRIAEDSFYGRQFELALRLFDGDVFVFIAGDAQCSDWNQLVTSCLERFEHMPQLGVWSPEIDNTGWSTDRVAMGHGRDYAVKIVAQTDSIVWALSPSILARLRQLDLVSNNLGWGIDWAAIAIAYSTGKIAIRDTRVGIHHPAGRAYSPDVALQQMEWLPVTSKRRQGYRQASHRATKWNASARRRIPKTLALTVDFLLKHRDLRIQDVEVSSRLWSHSHQAFVGIFQLFEVRDRTHRRACADGYG